MNTNFKDLVNLAGALLFLALLWGLWLYEAMTGKIRGRSWHILVTKKEDPSRFLRVAFLTGIMLLVPTVLLFEEAFKTIIRMWTQH